ncbi:hypothetical protein CLV92_11368 [Kineococcus xinjiangensis]|uniref:LVIVD repeat-containing protein n=1 Tax=Kineococcus xinjiangensis TaxID=512762 RepID=A0A2S6IEK9_9ACTN|nr:hypothetical protein [Kineococcus xinjiangensis]PPK92639.1 hypothetical protein CLV92_11368 [Kineococcus xinjiangensis]
MTASPKRLLALSAAAALATGAFVGISVPAQAHPDACTGDHSSHEHEHEDFCFSHEQIDEMDDSGAELGTGETASSENLKLVRNVPKVAQFSASNSFSTDLAFKDGYAYQGNYNGVTIYDVRTPTDPKVVSVIECPGAQNDVTIAGNTLVLSIDSSRSDDSCSSAFQTAEKESSWEGLRLYDISNPRAPRLLTTVETDCGSHTNTLVPDPANKRSLIYVSSYGPNPTFPGCQPPHDKISIVEIPDASPAAARVVAEPVLFPDGGATLVPANPSIPFDAGSRATDGCHDITAYPAKGIAAGACMGQGVLIDISDPVAPKVIDSVTDPNFHFWHSATFDDEAQTVVFTDELGGGGGPTCNPSIGPKRGANGIYRVVRTPAGPKLEFASYYKIPRVQHNTENCVAHNGSIIPLAGRDVMVQSWYQGGISVMDFTDPENPRELAWFDRGPLPVPDGGRAPIGGTWSAYWYNGHIFSSDIQLGLDVLKLDERSITAQLRPSPSTLNVQSQVPVARKR